MTSAALALRWLANGQALKKGGEEDRQNHRALAQERKNLGGRQAKESGHKILQIDVDFSERRTSS
jgi:hypothetical protein